LLLVALLAGCETPTPPVSPDMPAPGDHSLAFTAPDGVEHEFLLHAPQDFASGKRYPLVIVFHGSPGNPAEMVVRTGMSDLADTKGFIVVYPDRVRDPQTVAQLIDHLTPKWSVDPKRVHATGFSMGATAVYAIAEVLTARFGSVAPVSGTGAGETAHTSPISLITFQGGRDTAAYAFPANNANWAKAAGCQGNEIAKVALEGGQADRHTATCAGSAEFVLYDLPQMGHTWPAGASSLIWDFFDKHPLP